MHRLRMFQGYTVDMRLRQFRRLIVDEVMEYIDFDTPQGQELLEAYFAQEHSRAHHHTHDE